MNASLSGKRVLVTRPRAQAGGFIEKLETLGALPVIFPTIEIAPPEDTGPLDQAIANLDTYRWVIFTSVNGVAAFWQRLAALGRQFPAGEHIQVAAIGPATARSLREHGVEPDFVPLEYVAEAILPGLQDVSGQRVLLPRADIARKALAEELQRQGAIPVEVAVYRTLPAQPGPQELAVLRAGVDIATFTSSSTVKNFFELLGAQAAALLQKAVIACIGPITARTAQSYGLAVHVIADEYTTDGLIDALLAYVQSQSQGNVDDDSSNR